MYLYNRRDMPDALTTPDAVAREITIGLSLAERILNNLSTDNLVSEITRENPFTGKHEIYGISNPGIRLI